MTRSETDMWSVSAIGWSADGDGYVVTESNVETVPGALVHRLLDELLFHVGGSEPGLYRLVAVRTFRTSKAPEEFPF